MTAQENKGEYLTDLDLLRELYFSDTPHVIFIYHMHLHMGISTGTQEHPIIKITLAGVSLRRNELHINIFRL